MSCSTRWNLNNLMMVMLTVMYNLMIATRYQSQIPVSPSASSDQLGEEEESSNQE